MFNCHGNGWVWLFGALLLVGLVLLTVVGRLVSGGVRAGGTSARASVRGDSRQSARRLLDERYARGEVSTEEHQERRRVLDEGH